MTEQAASDAIAYVRLPADLKFSLETIARTDRRSLNAEIVYILELYVRQRMQDETE